MKLPIQLEYLLISSAHNLVGHYGGPAGETPAVRCPEVRLIPGYGIEGDRFQHRDLGHARQITFFDLKDLEALSAHLGRTVPPEAVRRNVFVRGLDLPALEGKRFEIQGARFEGSESCKPCDWMDQTAGPGAEAFLKDRGGLRARILSGDRLVVGPASFHLEPLP
ncbi:MAG: molybdenum cofactor biosysynthesis protein [Kiritimatiellia bacterium]|nr:molybdenum cofactor biosysynthesis protein [Kiritimatiellia bacterium]